MSASAAWKGVSLGVFLIALAAIVHYERLTWHWILVVMAAMSFVNALLKRSWKFAPHPLMWGAGLAYAIVSPEVGGWTMILLLCGASVILSFLLGLVPRRAPREAAPPPPRPGDGVVIDVEVTKRDV